MRLMGPQDIELKALDRNKRVRLGTGGQGYEALHSNAGTGGMTRPEAS